MYFEPLNPMVPGVFSKKWCVSFKSQLFKQIMKKWFFRPGQFFSDILAHFKMKSSL